jgi:phage-related protein
MIDSFQLYQEGKLMHPHYYIMKGKKILRLEAEMNFSDQCSEVQDQLLDPTCDALNQEQANWRVVIFRDEILEIDEYLAWLATAEASQWVAEYELELVAN